MARKKKSKGSGSNIAVNSKARHDYFIEERLEAGLALQGWEVKSLRDGHLQLKEGYVTIRQGELWLIGANIAPLASASTHVNTEPTRSRKLLLHRREIDRLIGAVERRGYALVPLSMYWKYGRAKLEIGLARGKKLHDKRATMKDRDWQRPRQARHDEGPRLAATEGAAGAHLTRPARMPRQASGPHGNPRLTLRIHKAFSRS